MYKLAHVFHAYNAGEETKKRTETFMR